MLKKLVYTGIALCLLAIAGCNNEQNDEQEQTESVIDDVETESNELESLQAENQLLNERNQYLVTTIKQVLDNLSDEELLEFSRNQISYLVQINGKSIPKNGHVTISEGNVEVLLVEQVLGYDFLPDEWLEKGRVSGSNYIDHLLDFDTTNWVPIALDGTVNTGQGYQLADVKAGQQFSFTITDELKERLKMDTNSIQINVE